MTKPRLVIHIGPGGADQGGMSQVLSEYAAWSFEEVVVDVWTSTVGRRDLLSPVRWLKCIIRLLLASMARTRPVIVVHVSQGGSFVREGSITAISRVLRLPTAVHIHGSRFEAFSLRRPRLVRTVLRAAQRIFVLTAATSRTVESLGIPLALIRLVRNGVEVPMYSLPKENTILFAGEISERKGADVLLESWKLVSAKAPHWRLEIAGPDVAHLIPSFEGVGNVSWLGIVHRNIVLERALRASISVLPSRDEALPMFLLESMARGCAVVSTPVGEIPSLLEASGTVVPSADHKALALALIALIEDSSMRLESAAAAMRVVCNLYSADVVRLALEHEWLDLGGRVEPER